LAIDNRVVLDIVPAAASEEMQAEIAASPQPPGEAQQPAAPAPQVPTRPTTEAGVAIGAGEKVTEQQPADPPQQTERGSGPLHT
jgi:hypothetical protein